MAILYLLWLCIKIDSAKILSNQLRVQQLLPSPKEIIKYIKFLDNLMKNYIIVGVR